MEMRKQRTEPRENKEGLELSFVFQELPPSLRMRHGWGLERRVPLSFLSHFDTPTKGETQTVTAPFLKIIPQKIRECSHWRGQKQRQIREAAPLESHRTLFPTTLHDLGKVLNVSEPQFSQL